MVSLPSRECGLKYQCIIRCVSDCGSLPSRESGLKLAIYSTSNVRNSRSLRGSVDWWIERAILILVHTLRLISKMMLQNLPKNDKRLLEMK